MRPTFRRWIILAVLLMSGSPGIARGAEQEIGQVVFVQGSASIRHLEGKIEAARFSAPVFLMDTLETGNGELRVLFRDKTILSLGTHSKVMLTENIYKPSQGIRRSLFDILKGKVRTIVDQSEAYQTNDVRLETPTAVAGIRGTDVGTNVLSSATQFLCFDGAFVAYFRDNPENGVTVTRGQFSEISGPVPSAPAVITPQLMQQFSPQLGAPPLRDILEQPGGESLQTPEETVNPSEASEAPATQTDQTQIIPGGSSSTPVAAGSGTAPVQVPVSFPHGVR